MSSLTNHVITEKETHARKTARAEWVTRNGDAEKSTKIKFDK